MRSFDEALSVQMPAPYNQIKRIIATLLNGKKTFKVRIGPANNKQQKRAI